MNHGSPAANALNTGINITGLRGGIGIWHALQARPSLAIIPMVRPLFDASRQSSWLGCFFRYLCSLAELGRNEHVGRAHDYRNHDGALRHGSVSDTNMPVRPRGPALMTQYSAFVAANGGNGYNFATGYSSYGDIQVALQFTITQVGYQIKGFYAYWDGSSIFTAYDACLWQWSSGSGWAVVATTDTAFGTLSAGWNLVPLATPFTPTVGTLYAVQLACTGGFYWVNNGLCAGSPMSAQNGIVNGPLTVFSGNAADSGGNPSPSGLDNGTFGEVSTTSATTALAEWNYESGAPGVDLLVGPAPAAGGGLLLASLF